MTVGRPYSCGNAGAVLAFVVLLMLALLGLGHGLLVASLGEVAASSAAVRHLTARAAADGVVSAALRKPYAPWMDSVPVDGARVTETVSLGRAASAATLRRLTRESWFVEGRGALRDGVDVRVARLAWSLDPLERVTKLPGVLSAAPGSVWTLDGVVDAGAPARVDPPLDGVDCAPWLVELEERYAIPPAQMGFLSDTVDAPWLGLIDFPSLLARAPVLVSGVGTPEPVERFGACAEDEPWGWGDPENPSRACGPHLPLRASPGDLSVVGGVGQGVLAVEGDLTLTAGARYYGLVVVRGALRLEDGASLDGFALALGGGSVDAGSSVRGSACWAVRALAAQRAVLGGLVAVPGVGPIGPL
ncbi:MAG TPA: hypothetical protein VMM35_10840 [Longimicrobiales bacterium]|nr:hypothetical protein [Longimicrobiales bacterium]